MDLSDMYEWDTKTLASSLKGYIGKQLGEPLMTFRLHEGFIEASSEAVIRYTVAGERCLGSACHLIPLVLAKK